MSIEDRLQAFAKESMAYGQRDTVAFPLSIREWNAWLAGDACDDRAGSRSRVVCCFGQRLSDSVTSTEFPSNPSNVAAVKALASRIAGAEANEDVERKRAIDAVDWALRICVPMRLDFAGMTGEAEELRALPALTMTNAEAVHASAMKLVKVVRPRDYPAYSALSAACCAVEFVVSPNDALRGAAFKAASTAEDAVCAEYALPGFLAHRDAIHASAIELLAKLCEVTQ